MDINGYIYIKLKLDFWGISSFELQTQFQLMNEFFVY